MIRFTTAFIAVLALAAGGFAQSSNPLPAASFDVFAGILNYHRIAPMSLDEVTPSEGERLLLVILGRMPPTERVRLSALSRRILTEGGSVLIASDEPLSLTSLLPDGTTLAVTGEKMECINVDSTWNDITRCPLIEPRPLNPTRLQLAPDETALLFTVLNRIATNLPSRLTVPANGTGDWQLLADLPAGTVVVGQNKPLGRVNRLFAAGASGKPGRALAGKILVLADSGLLTNQMLAPAAGLPDNDNLALADRIVLWMQGSPVRTRAVVVVDGVPLTQFDGVPLTAMPPIPPMPLPDFLDPAVQAKMTQAVNEAIGKFERNDGFNRLMLGSDDAARPRRLNRFLLGLAVALGIFVLILGLNRLRNRVHQPQTDLAPAEKFDGKVVKLGRIDARREALLNSGRATDSVPLFLREWFQAAVMADGAMVGDSGTMPEIAVLAGGRVKPLANQIRILWETAQTHGSVSYGRWKELQPMLMDVIGRRRAGEWRFAAGDDS